jgi:uncharacterized RDD family membrane protein YckC
MSRPPRHTIVSAWTRCQAQIVDMIIVLIATSALAMIWYGNGVVALKHPSVWIAFAVIGLLYFTLFEWRSGQTPGKMLLDIEVRRVDGGDPSLAQALVSTVFRLVDGLGFYVVGALVMRMMPERQRLGGRVAGTIVVRSRPDAPTLRNDGTHASEQPEADEFNTVLESEIGRPPRQ